MVSHENSQLLEKMTVAGMNLRDLNVILLLHYSFMYNPRYCLGCATQKNDLHSFIFFYKCYCCVPNITFLWQFAIQASRKDPTISLQYKKMYPTCA